MKKKSVPDLITYISTNLHHHPSEYAWWILEALTKRRKGALIAHGITPWDDSQQHILDEWIERLTGAHEPLQYLLGSVPFGPLTITVRPPTLIPRYETEYWCEQLIKRLAPIRNEPLTILDLCTGSGCIALALAHALPNAHVYGTDIRHNALTLARENALNNTITNVTFLQSDIYQSIGTQTFDLIVANPPYISAAEYATVEPSVTQWEDHAALVAACNGHALITRIITDAHRYLRPHPLLQESARANLFIEIGHTQGPATAQLLHEHHAHAIKVECDLAGKERVASAFISTT